MTQEQVLSDGRQKKAEQIFLEALELSPSQRVQFVNERLAFPGCEDRGRDGQQHQDALGDPQRLCLLTSERSGQCSVIMRRDRDPKLRDRFRRVIRDSVPNTK